MTRAAILVLGMHRSGTSALTWLLGQLGAALPSDAIAASGDNARGYWESQGLVRADDQLLRAARSSWFDPRPLDLSTLPPDGLASRKRRIREAIAAAWGEAPLLAIKDPRQCRFVPLVAEVLAEMGVAPRAVLMLRSAAEIARSIESRDTTTPAYAHLLWLRHMIEAERATRGMPRAIVSYDDMLANWRGVVGQLTPLTGRDAESVDAAKVEAFLDAGLRHHRAGAAALEQPLAGIVAEVEDGLRALIAQDDPDTRLRLDAAYGLLEARPWLEGDIVHDELRHRRVDATPPVEAEPEAPLPEPPSPAPEAPPPAPDPSGDAALIRASGLFDGDWYRARYPDAADSGLDPVDHYLQTGAALGYDPSPLFDTGYYARQLARRMKGACGH